jgi:O-antigen/teichoic acid export membrane protein
MRSEVINCNGSSTRDAGGSEAIARHQIRGSSGFLIGNVISLAITLFPHLVLVRFLSTEGYGHWTYALSLVAVGKTYALGFNECMSRFVPIYDARRDVPKLLGTVVVVFGVTLLISGILLGTFAAVPHLIFTLLTKGKEAPGLFLVLMFLVPFESLNLLTMNLLACFGRAREVFWLRYIFPPGLRAVAIAILVLSRSNIYFLAYAYVLVEAVMLLLVCALIAYRLHHADLLRRHTGVQLPIRELFAFAVPLMLSNAVGMLGNSIPVLLLGYFCPISTVAFYRVVLPAAVLTSMIPSNFMPLYVPAASRLFAKCDMRGINQLFWETSLWMSVLAFPLFIATTCFAAPLTASLYGSRYAPSVPILAILSLGYFVNVIFAFNSVTLKVLGKVRLMVVLNIITPIIIVLFNVLLIPRYGAIGAAVATTSGMVVQNLLRQFSLWLWGGGISLFEKRHASLLLLLILSPLPILLVRHILPNSLFSNLSIFIGVTGLVLWAARHHLKIAETFPEIHRVPLARKLFT